MKTLCKDLTEEYEALDTMVSLLDHDEWMKPTPFFGWTVKEEISHLAYFDRAARISISGKDQFDAHMNEMLKHASTYDEIFDYANSQGLAMGNRDLLAWWRRERHDLISAYQTCDPKQKLPWYGPPMSARSSATARLMETWAHGQDIADALSIKRKGTPRLKHIVHIGFSTFAWSFINRSLPAPEKKAALILHGPSGEIWTYGEPEWENTVRGSAFDFCLVVTQRRHVNDTALIVEGDAATSWMGIAQAFAGPPEEPPAPGSRV